MLERSTPTLTVLSLLFTTTLAHAQPNANAAGSQVDEPSPMLSARDHRDDGEIYARLELTMGFVGGFGYHADLSLAQGTLPPGALDGGPVNGAPMAGLRYDLRLVVSIVRMTVGGDLLWALFSARERSHDGHLVRDDRLFDGALRFGLGLEADLDGVRLFADVLGTVHFVEHAIVVDGAIVTGTATTFAPGGRIGVRVPIVPHFFAQVALDASPFGPGWIGGDFSVGGAFE